MGQLLSGASGDGRQPPARSWAPLADPRETGEDWLAEARLPGVARDDISAGLAGQELVISGEFRDPASTAGRCAAGGARHGQQVTVITFWSGIAGDGPDGPLIFCTCAGIRAPGGRHPAYQRLWGWPDLAAARAGHQAITVWIAGLADFLAGHADQLPAPNPALSGQPPAGDRR